MIMNLGALKFLYIFIALSSLTFSVYSKPIEANIAKIQILDKITARMKNFSVDIENSIYFESLEIKIFSCYKNPPEEIPENFVFLEIYDKINTKNNNLIYRGWMISSSPASTPLEHPIYDVWLKDCAIRIDF